MTVPRASLLRRLSWWLRGGPARLSARSCRRSGIPARDAAILGWCVLANSTIVLFPFGMVVAIVLGIVRGHQEPRP